ncbi:GNAT family N-acetyltransferase [Flavitalea flava]
MEHILDNPIWNASITGNKEISFGSEDVKYLDRKMSVFSGLRENTEKNLNELYTLTPFNTTTILFIEKEIIVPAPWEILLKKGILQMVYGQSWPADEDTGSLIPLRDKDIPAMMELTDLTKPGPFLTRTLDFGNYEGIFAEGKLIAMCGQRLQPDPYSELSAVCTHPDHLGKGYAKLLIRNQLRKILKANRIPFLHLYADNVAACKLYEKMGFTTRKEMLVYMLEKKPGKGII